MNNDIPFFWGAFGLYAGATLSYGGFLAVRRQQLARMAAVSNTGVLLGSP